MTKAYIIKEIHDSSEDTSIIGVSLTRDVAEIVAQKNRNKWNLPDCEITLEKYNEMMDNYWQHFSEIKGKDYRECLYTLYPEYSISDIDNAVHEYEYISYCGTIVEEVPLYETILCN